MLSRDRWSDVEAHVCLGDSASRDTERPSSVRESCLGLLPQIGQTPLVLLPVDLAPRVACLQNVLG